MNVSYSQLEEYKNEIEQIKNKIEESFNNIKASSEKIGNDSTWDGQAARNYKSKIATITSTFEERIAELNSVVLYLQSVINNYKSVDEKVMNSLNVLG